MATKKSKRATATERGLHPILLTTVTPQEARRLQRAASESREDDSRTAFILDAALKAANKVLP